MPFDEPTPVDTVDHLQAKIAQLEAIAVGDVALYVTARKGVECASNLADLARAGAAAIKLSTYEFHPVQFPRFTTGADADIAVFRPGSSIFDERSMTSAVEWSQFDRREMAGEVVATCVRGQPTFEQGRVVAAPGYGRFLHPREIKQ